MAIFRDLFLTKRKKPQKKFIATARGHAPWGLGVSECFYNLYEYEDGSREYEELQGGQYHEIPQNADYSTKAQVKAWLYGGNIPTSVLNYEALIDEINKTIPKQGYEPLVCKITDDGEVSYSHSHAYDIDKELEKALDIQLGKKQNEKNVLTIKHE
ncbi:hypothetical protein [Bartonella machadoae]|uniref:hypothetical protein n=1 Tax=Bartonella machadoae TaxID=2893471 RepID=UPI001F4CD5FA|nr:hypothetical protein [Bartonella machadoae]UNE54931.1 hypothetical protein LNM86_03490 [Bartonella machadoae]